MGQVLSEQPHNTIPATAHAAMIQLAEKFQVILGPESFRETSS